MQQTSPSPVCPGDNVTFTCTVTGNKPTITWINPKNMSYDRKVYSSNSVLYQDGNVGAFTTQLIGISDVSIVSIATLSGVTVQDDENQGITCRYLESKTVKVTLSGILYFPSI